MNTLKKPLSPDRLAANRANALTSTGPRTPAGKARSSQNALTHGLTASLSTTPSAASPRDITALGEDRSLLPATLQSFLASWNPQSPFEVSLVEDLASLRVRLKRCVRMESGLIDTEIPAISPTGSHERVNAALGASFAEQQATFTRFSRCEANLSRAYDRTLKQLLSVRKAGLQPTDGPAAAPTVAVAPAPTPAPTPEFDKTNPPAVENKQPPAAPPADEPNHNVLQEDIRTQRNPPAAPGDPVNRRHGGPTIVPPRPDPDVRLVWIRKDEFGNDVEYKL